MAATGAENPFRVPGFEDDGMGLFSDQMADLDPSVLQPGPYYGTQFEIELNNGLQHPTGKAALQPVAALQHVIKPLVDLLESWDARILELTVQYVRVLFGCIGKPLTFTGINGLLNVYNKPRASLRVRCSCFHRHGVNIIRG